MTKLEALTKQFTMQEEVDTGGCKFEVKIN